MRNASTSQQLSTRTLDAAIRLIGSLFPYQSKEHVDKLIQLCAMMHAQAVAGASGAGKAHNSGSISSSNLSIFSSYDEERRKKEFKSYVIQKNIVAVIAAVVRNYPFEKLRSDLTSDPTAATSAAYPTPYSWCDTFSAWLLESINHSNLEIKFVSAVCLTSLAGNLNRIYCATTTMNGSGSDSIVASPIGKLFSSLSSGLNSQITVLDPNNRSGEMTGTGFLLSLGLLWAQAGDSLDAQNNILVVSYNAFYVHYDFV